VRDRLKAVKISDYAMKDADEFLAEAFTQDKIGSIHSPYADELMGVVDKYFKKSGVKAAETVEKSGKSGIIKADKVISGHAGTPKKSEPNTIIDHVDEKGTVDARGFYGYDGLKEKDIHTTDHGNPKRHPYGKHGEHAHDYTWADDGRLKEKTTRNLNDDEKGRNGDIL
jgi:hypothetical protein